MRREGTWVARAWVDPEGQVGVQALVVRVVVVEQLGAGAGRTRSVGLERPGPETLSWCRSSTSVCTRWRPSRVPEQRPCKALRRRAPCLWQPSGLLA